MEMNWSRWFRCESSFGLLLVPTQPGIYALAEETGQAGPQSRPMLAVCEVDETADLLRSLTRLFASGAEWRERMEEGRCFLRYAVVPDAGERRTAATALKKWLHAPSDAAAPPVFGQRPPETETAKTEAERAVDRVTERAEYAKFAGLGL
jgi:hypothetical protein